MHPTPSFTRVVAAESAPSRPIESGRGLAITLSPTHTESNMAIRSASRASASICGQVATPKRTPRCGIVNPKLTFPAIVAPPARLAQRQTRALQQRGIECPLPAGQHHFKRRLPPQLDPIDQRTLRAL